MPALLYGFFACYAVTGKCELRTDSQGQDIAVFASVEDCQRFGSDAARKQPNKEGKWMVGDGHYYQCFRLTPLTAAAAAPPDGPRAVYSTTADALQHDFQTNPDALTRKIGTAMVEISGIVDHTALQEGGELQLSASSANVTAWLTQDGIASATTIGKHAVVTLRCDRIGTLVAPSARHPGVVEVRGCTLLSGG